MKLIRFMLWLGLTVALLLMADQFILKRHFTTPGLTQVQTFYRDFRARLLTLGRTDAYHDDIGQTIETELTPPADQSARYLYVDRDGVLHFADHLDEVPTAYRQDAQRLAE